MGATIGAACAAGTASVAVGAFTGWGPLAAPLMIAANAGKMEYWLATGLLNTILGRWGKLR